MASLSVFRGSFSIRFRHSGKPYKRTLKTTDKSEAEAALNLVGVTLHRIRTAQLVVPPDVDVAEFVVSGGKITAPLPAPATPVEIPSVATLIEKYLAAQFTKAASSVSTERTHLNNLKRELGAKADLPVDQIRHADLTLCLQQRRQNRQAETVKKERVTICQFFGWAIIQGVLSTNPAANLPKIKGSGSRQRFRTIAEIETLIERGGLTAEQQASLWDCLYLGPTEITELLHVVGQRAKADFSHLLHIVPAFTGMRRGEILRLRWADVDFDAGYITARSKKQSRQVVETSRQIDLHPELRAELLAWRQTRPKGQLIISAAGNDQPLTRDSANTHFWQPMRGTSWCLDGKRNLFKVGYHTFRHSFASNLAAAGVDSPIIDAFLGHTTKEMQARYRHLFPKNRRDAIERLLYSVSAPTPAPA